MAKSSKNPLSNGEKVSCVKRTLLALFVVVLALFVATAAACIALGIEISKLKSEASVEPQLVGTVPQEDFSNLYDEVWLLNTSFNRQLSQTYTKLNSNIEQVETSLCDKIQRLNDLIDRVNSSLGSGLRANVPAASCAALPPSSPPDYYWIAAPNNNSAVRVYCDTTRSCGGVTGGWTRVAYLDMTDSSQQCPSALRERNDSDTRTCAINSDAAGCSSVEFSTTALVEQYSMVCGRIRGYQVLSTDAFGIRASTLDIDSNYVDGVSLTYGSPRQHIWTFAAGFDETNPAFSCPCIAISVAAPPPDFVGNNYFCDTGAQVQPASIDQGFLGDDPLWDGDGCGFQNMCCSFNTPPWFHRQLPQPTTGNIEMRVCRDEDINNEDVAIELIEIYVQ